MRGPGRHLEKRGGREQDAGHRDKSTSEAAGEPTAKYGADGDPDEEARQEQTRTELGEAEHKASEYGYVDKRHHQRDPDQEMGAGGADEAAASKKLAWHQRLQSTDLPPAIERQEGHARDPGRDQEAAGGAMVGVIR